MAKRFRVVGADRQQRDLGPRQLSDLFKAFEIGAVAGVINPPPLMLQNEPAISPMKIAQDPCSPMLGRSEGHPPVVMRKTLPPVQLNDAAKSQVISQVANAPRHDRDLGMRQSPQRRFVEVIKMRM